MPTSLVVVAGIFGLVFGSFVTALTYRLPRGISIARGRSACTACGHALGWRDLFPVLSWATSGGRCRHCGAAISWRYPAIEILSATLFAATAAAPLGAERSLVLMAMTPILLALAVFDLERAILPNTLIFPLALLALVWRWKTGAPWLQGLVSAAVVGVFAIALDAATRHIARDIPPLLGGGDAKLLVVAAIVFSLPHFFLFLTVSGLIGCVFGLAWQRAAKTERFPFGPGLCLGIWAVALLSDRMPFQ